MLQEIWNIVNTKIGVAVVTAVATTILNVIYNMWRMNKDQKMRFENVIGDKVAQALDAVRDLELKINVQEIYQVEDCLEKKNMDMFNLGAVYPAIMNSVQDFTDFMNQVNKAREEYEKYLDYKTAAYLYYMEKYSMNLAKYIADNQPLGLQVAGAIFYGDLQKWQKKYDKLIIKKINRQKCRLYSKDGWRWEQAKKDVMNKLWKKSVLYGLMENINNPEINAAYAVLYHGDAEKAMKELEEYNKKHRFRIAFRKLIDKI